MSPGQRGQVEARGQPARLAALHRRARAHGARPWLYWPARAVLEPLARTVLWARVVGGRRHIPARGPLVVVANHRSFLDPFLLCGLFPRPIAHLAKAELFGHPVVAWLLVRAGAFPVRRGGADPDARATALALLRGGGIVVVFPEGTRTRPGPLGSPHSGAAWLALETGAPLLPVAVHGTEDVRRGWRVRPRPVRVLPGRLVHARPGETPDALMGRAWREVEQGWDRLTAGRL